MGEIPENRCGYKTDYEQNSLQPGNICCFRPTWKEFERCIWHTDVERKPPSEYYHLTEHGENLWQVVKWSGGVIGAWTLFYLISGGIANTERTHSFWSLSDPSVWDVLLLIGRSLYFSTVTFTTLGYGDYHPVGPTAKALAGVESLLGALLVALFVFVLGRRVAR